MLGDLKDLLKYLPKLLLLKQVFSAYKAEKGGTKPWMLTRRFLSAVILAAVGIIGYKNPELVKQITEYVVSIADHGQAIALAGTALYGLVMQIVGWVKRQKDA